MTSPCSVHLGTGRERRGRARMRGEEREERGPVREMDRRQPMVVGFDVGEGRVVQDHPCGAALQDVEALLDATVDAALAGHDLADERCPVAAGASHSARLYGAAEESTTGMLPIPAADRRADERGGGPAAGDREGGVELASLRGRGDRRDPR